MTSPSLPSSPTTDDDGDSIFAATSEKIWQLHRFRHSDRKRKKQKVNHAERDAYERDEDKDEEERISRQQKYLYDTLAGLHERQQRHNELFGTLLKIDAKIQYYVHGHLVAMTANHALDGRDIHKEYLGGNYLVGREELYRRLLIQLRDPSSPLHLANLIFEHNVFDFQQYDRLARIAVESLYGMLLQRDEHLQRMYFVDSIMQREFDNYTQDPVNFLRANTFSSKLLTCFAREIGRPFLTQVLSPHLRRILEDQPQLDLDPLRVYKQLDIQHDPLVKTRDQMAEIAEVREEILRRVPILTQYCEGIICSIFDNALSVPFAIRWICNRLCGNLSRRAKTTNSLMTTVQRNSIVSSFFFLRFLMPVIVTPEFVLEDRIEPATTEERTLLTNISRIIDKLSSTGLFNAQKEWYYEGMNAFLGRHRAHMSSFIDQLVAVQENDHMGDIIFCDATTLAQNQFLQVEKGDLYFLHTEIVARSGSLHMNDTAAQLIQQLGHLEVTDSMLDDHTRVVFRFRTPKLPAIRRYPGVFVGHQLVMAIRSFFTAVDQLSLNRDRLSQEPLINLVRSIDSGTAQILEELPSPWCDDNYRLFVDQAITQCNKYHSIFTLLQQDECALKESERQLHKNTKRCSSKIVKFKDFLLETKLTVIQTSQASPRKSPRKSPRESSAPQKLQDSSSKSQQEIPIEYKSSSSSHHLRRQSTLFGNLLGAMKKKQSQLAVTTFSFRELVEAGLLREQQIQELGPEAKNHVIEFNLEEPGRVSMTIKAKQSSNLHRRRSLSQFMAHSAKRLSLKFSRKATPQDDDSIVTPIALGESLSFADLENTDTMNKYQLIHLDELLDSLFDKDDSQRTIMHSWNSLVLDRDALLKLCAKMFFIKATNSTSA